MSKWEHCKVDCIKASQLPLYMMLSSLQFLENLYVAFAQVLGYSLLYQWNTTLNQFVLYEDFYFGIPNPPGNFYVEDFEFMTLNGNYYLAQSNADAGTYESTLYKWNGTGFLVNQHFSYSTYGITGGGISTWWYCVFGSNTWLVASSNKGAMVLSWNGTQFGLSGSQPFGYSSNSASFDFATFVSGTNTFAVNAKSTVIQIYQYTSGTTFTSVQNLTTTATTIFHIGIGQVNGNTLLAVAAQTPDTSSAVYLWNNSTNQFSVISSISWSYTVGDIQFLTIDSKMYMFVTAAASMNHYVYKWNPYVKQFDLFATIPYSATYGTGLRWDFLYYNNVNWVMHCLTNSVNLYQLY